MTDNQKIAELLFPNNKLSVEEIEKKYKPRNLPSGAQVTRFAPSPTGFLHLGNFFQAVVDFFIAKQTNGVFFFRLEDTDKKREIEGADKVALSVINSYGVSPSEGLTLDGQVGDYGPYRQSERIEVYQAYAKMLVEKGRAFPCFCSAAENKEEIASNREKMLEETSTILEHDCCRDLSFEDVQANIKAGKPFAIRLRSMNNEGDKIKVFDKIKGEREIPANLKDTVLVKSDKIPPYPFAHAVDDHLMKTTTVVRGEDWFSSIAQHIEIFEALGFDKINYLHTALICKIDENGNKRKLSKRLDREADMRYFSIVGYPKTAVIEYMLTLANSNFEDWRRENSQASVFDFPFTIEKMGNSNPMFDIVKLNDISKNVISRMKAENLFKEVLDWSQQYDLELYDVLLKNRDLSIKTFNIDREIERPRKDITIYSEIKNLFSYMFKEFLKSETLIDFDEKYNRLTIIKLLENYKDKFDLNVDKNQWFMDIKNIAGEVGFATDNKEFKLNPTAFEGNIADACNIIRIAITGKSQTPDLYSIMQVLGSEEIIHRLDYAIKNI